MSIPKLFRFYANELHPYGSLSIPNKYTFKPCPTCARIRHEYSGEATVRIADRGRKWYDIIHTESIIPIVSERVVEALKNATLVGWEAFPVTIESVESRKLAKLKPPNYTWLKIQGAIKVSESPSIVGEIEACPVCRHLEGIEGPTQLVPEGVITSDSESFFEISNIWLRHRVCTRRVVDLARENGWTNFRFEPLDVPLKRRPAHIIDYLGKKWPPQWYPDGFEPHPNNLEEVEEYPDPRLSQK